MDWFDFHLIDGYCGKVYSWNIVLYAIYVFIDIINVIQSSVLP